MILAALMLLTAGLQAQALVIHVAPDGNDRAPGTEDEPLQSIAMAQRKAREYRRLNAIEIRDALVIRLHNGVYELGESLLIRPEDGGTEASPTLFLAAEEASPVISGGTPVSGWRPVKEAPEDLSGKAMGKLWWAPAPLKNGRTFDFRQLWVKGVKATRASSMDNGPLPRILSIDKEAESFLIEKPGFEFGPEEHPEFVIHQWWAIAVLRVRDIRPEGKNARISFHQPESRIEFEHPWPAPFMDRNNEYNGNSAYFFVNSLSLLDSPGEWYLDRQAGRVYYWPREGEDLREDRVIVPFLETLVSVAGTADNPVSNIVFQGIGFAYSSWLRPSREGHVPLQAGMYIRDAYKLTEPGTPDKASLENQAWTGRQPAGVELIHASRIRFEDCSFRHMAATGLDMICGVQKSRVQGSIFSDIGGTGLQAGFFGDISHEAHLPYDPLDSRDICRELQISDNLVTNVSNEDWGCVGISLGHVQEAAVTHNEVSYLNYSGICVGWGWTRTLSCARDNLISGNHIHHFARMMYDVGGIYTLSAQPNTEISRNSIHHLEKAPYAHIPEHFQYIYLDEGSSYIRVRDNWTEKDRFFSNSPGPGNEWKNNGPLAGEDIKREAGLREQYRHLLKEYEHPGFPFCKD